MSPAKPPNSMSLFRCSVRYFCLGALLIFIGSVLLCAFGFTIVLPYEATNFWPQVICRVTNVSYSAEFCSCGKHTYLEPQDYAQSNEPSRFFDVSDDIDNGCSDEYPCLQIGISFNISQEHILKFRSLENYTSGTRIDGFIYRSWSDAFFKTCTLHECGDEEWNIKETRRFRYRWGQRDMTYQCYYNPEDPEQAILERITFAQVVHAIVWPSAALGTGALIWLGLCLGCWKIEMDQNQQPIIDRTSSFL